MIRTFSSIPLFKGYLETRMQYKIFHRESTSVTVLGFRFFYFFK